MRKRLTERFPFLLPLRQWQRKRCFYLHMRLDGRRYASDTEAAPLGEEIFRSACPMYNEKTGFPMEYQQNKVFNLRLAARKLDGLLIRPGQTFSFWHCVKNADRETPYRDALSFANGRLQPAYGGGLCQLSNLLCWLLLHTPLVLTERHGHSVKDFPEPESDAPMGVDAAVAEGWLDLKASNPTEKTFQLCIGFTEREIVGSVRALPADGERYEVHNRGLCYYRRDGQVFERTDVVRQTFSGGVLQKQELLYRSSCRIAYRLPEGTIITEGETNS